MKENYQVLNINVLRENCLRECMQNEITSKVKAFKICNYLIFDKYLNFVLFLIEFVYHGIYN
jgi:hypothetical protein